MKRVAPSLALLVLSGCLGGIEDSAHGGAPGTASGPFVDGSTVSTSPDAVDGVSASDAGSASDAASGPNASDASHAKSVDAGHDAAMATGGTSLDGVAIFPATSPWNEDISNAPLDPNSAAYIAEMAPTTGMHADFSNIVDGNYGIPYVVVNGSQAMMPIKFTQYASQSDPGPYPIPLTAPIEGMGVGDSHVIAIDTANHMLYELYTASVAGSSWDAACGAKFDLTGNDAQRPAGWTSADAAGLPIFPGLTRPDEVIDNGVITHALRFTMVKTYAGYVAPARHYASSNTNSNVPPMGLRVRLKANVDISAAGPQAKVILTALKKYGMILADNGSNWYVSGSPDARWNDDDLHTMGKITGSDFEVVQHGPIGNAAP